MTESETKTEYEVRCYHGFVKLLKVTTTTRELKF